jgi:hypothetical protein
MFGMDKFFVKNIAEPQEKGVPESSVDMTGALEAETQEDIQNEPERRERIQRGLEMLWNRYDMRPGDMKNKSETLISLLVKAQGAGEGDGLTEHEGRLASTRRIVTELGNKMDAAKLAKAEMKHKEETGQISRK